MDYKIRAIKKYFDMELNKPVEREDILVVGEDRKNKLVELGLAESIEKLYPVKTAKRYVRKAKPKKAKKN